MHAHLVFVTKFRHHVFSDRHLTRCEEIMRNVGAPLTIVHRYIENQNRPL